MSKAKAKTYKSEAMAAVHEMMEGLSDAGSIDKRTMREFDEACLAPAPVLSPDEIKAIRALLDRAGAADEAPASADGAGEKAPEAPEDAH